MSIYLEQCPCDQANAYNNSTLTVLYNGLPLPVGAQPSRNTVTALLSTNKQPTTTTMPSQNFLHFRALPEYIRDDIWERAVAAILTAKPAVQLMKLSREDTSLAHERVLVDEARAAVMLAAQADPAMDWGNNRMVRDLQMRQKEAGWDAARKHRVTLVTVTPDTPGGERLATFTAAWPLNDLAACCTEVYDVVRRYLRVGARHRGHGCSDFDPTNDIVYFSGLETPKTDASRCVRLLDTVYGFARTPSDSLERVLVRQIVVVGPPLPYSASTVDNYEHKLRCPTFREICPPLASLRRVAFEFRPDFGAGAGSVTLSLYDYCYRLGLNSLRPHNLPSLQEVYLIDKSIKPKASAVSRPLEQQLASVLSFAGCFSTFYEVSPNETGLWDIPTTDRGQVPVFLCARYLETEGFAPRGLPANPPLGVPVKVLAFVRHRR